MKKAMLLASAAVALAAVPAMAQDGPFKDVPNDHWAYQAIERLAQLKIVIGDPDGQYHGKRTLTRYEMAVMLARVLDILDQRYALKNHDHPKSGDGGAQVDLSGLATKVELRGVTSALDGKADKSDLAGLVKQSDLEMLRRMVTNFQAELQTLGVDVDGVKKRLTTLEGRVTAIENDLKKRVKVSGAFSTNVRSNFRDRNAAGTNGAVLSVPFVDKDGFRVGNPQGGRGDILADTTATHDLDLDLKAAPAEGTTFDASLSLGNYLPYAAGGSRTAATARQDQATTIWKAVLSTGVNLPIIGNTGLQIGRMPTMWGAYTFKTPDWDYYFHNGKTDMGTIPTDGVKANFKIAGINLTTQAAKINPVLSGPLGVSANLAAPVVAGATGSAYAGAGLTRTNTTGVIGTGARVGGAAANQFAGIGAGFNISRLNIGLSALSFGNTVSGTFDTTNVYGGNASIKLLGISFAGDYAKSETRGYTGGTRVNKVLKFNDAYDINGSIGRGNFNLKGGYRYVAPLFGAPGAWARVGSFQNPTDIKGAYGRVSYAVSNRIELMASTQSYQGTGKIATGLTKNDKIQNIGYGIHWGVTGSSTLSVSNESTDYTRTGETRKPREMFTNIGYNYTFNPSTSFRLLYQIADFDAKGNFNFVSDPNQNPINNRQKGNVIAGQFTVKF